VERHHADIGLVLKIREPPCCFREMKRATDLHTILADYIHIQTGYVLIFLCAYVVEEKRVTKEMRALSKT